ncbi:MAG TPA: presqualene diphosphate synthase HpnD, partial [Burkholderiales bacterium]
MTPDEYCQEKAAASGSSFYYSFLFLPPERRRAITALYAYCREVDDVVDETPDENVARIKLAWWRTELANMYAGNPQHPVTRALTPFLTTYNLTQERLNEILDGMEMDLLQTRYLDFRGLERYCYLVASVVGLCAAEIFGRTREETLEYAVNLGMAFQLTNIIRDVGEDGRRGRVYLPVNELQQFNLPVAHILNARYSDDFVKLMRFQYERAQGYYDKAFAALPKEDRRAQRPGLIMASIYRTLLEEIARDNFQVLHQRISLTP